MKISNLVDLDKFIKDELSKIEIVKQINIDNSGTCVLIECEIGDDVMKILFQGEVHESYESGFHIQGWYTLDDFDPCDQDEYSLEDCDNFEDLFLEVYEDGLIMKKMYKKLIGLLNSKKHKKCQKFIDKHDLYWMTKHIIENEKNYVN